MGVLNTLSYLAGFFVFCLGVVVIMNLLSGIFKSKDKK